MIPEILSHFLLDAVAPWKVFEEILIWRSTMHSDAFRRKCEKLRKSQMKRELRGFVVEGRTTQRWKGFLGELYK